MAGLSHNVDLVGSVDVCLSRKAGAQTVAGVPNLIEADPCSRTFDDESYGI